MLRLLSSILRIIGAAIGIIAVVLVLFATRGGASRTGDWNAGNTGLEVKIS
jgi:hypothetical protein